jgi:hypothetical protein
MAKQSLEPKKKAAYKVLVYKLQGEGKRVYDSGDIINKENLPGRDIDELIKEGFIEEVYVDDENTGIVLED